MTYIVNNSFNAKGNKNRQKRGLQWRFWLFLGVKTCYPHLQPNRFSKFYAR